MGTHICYGQMAGWIRMPLGTEVGLGLGDFVLDGDPAPPQKGGGAPSPIFGTCPLWPNGWMDQDGTWHAGGPWSRPHCARWGPSSPLQKWVRAPQIFGPFLLWPNCWVHQDATWCGGRPPPRQLCVRWGPSPSPPKGQSPQFLAHVYCGQTAA